MGLMRYGWQRFDEALSRKSPEEFVRDVLVGEIGAWPGGENFRFGHRAAGDFRELERLMRRLGGEAYAACRSGARTGRLDQLDAHPEARR